MARSSAPPGCLRFGDAPTLTQNPAESRDFSGCSRRRSESLCTRRLNGGASRIRTCSIALLSPALRWGESRANPNRPLGNREIRTCSVALPNPAHRRGESRANPNRPPWQQRKTRAYPRLIQAFTITEMRTRPQHQPASASPREESGGPTRLSGSQIPHASAAADAARGSYGFSLSSASRSSLTTRSVGSELGGSCSVCGSNRTA